MMFGTKWPSMISMWSQSAPASWIMREHSEKSLPKSEARIEGAMIGLGAILQIISFANFLISIEEAIGSIDSGEEAAVGGGFGGVLFHNEGRRAVVKQVTLST